MAIVVEDGTQGALASPRPNSYVTIQETRDFLEPRGDAVFVAGSPLTPTDALVEAALLRAWDYMLQRWRLRWRGGRIQPQQPGDWPRKGVPVPDFFDPFYRDPEVPFDLRDIYFIPENEVPQEVKEAQMFLCAAAFSDATTVVPLQTSIGRKTKREKLGDLEVEYFGNSEGGGRQIQHYYDAEMRVQPFLKSAFTGRALRA